MAEGMNSKPEKVEAPKTVSNIPKETAVSLVKQGPEAVNAKLNGIKVLEAQVAAKRGGDNPKKAPEYRYQDLSVFQFENFIKDLDIIAPVDLTADNINSFHDKLKVAAQHYMTYKNDGVFYKSSLGQDLSHYIREKIEELSAAKGKKEIEARNKKYEEESLDSEDSLARELAKRRAEKAKKRDSEKFRGR